MSAVVFDQSNLALSGEWNVLGSFTLDGNSYVSIAVDGGGVISADAVKFVRAGEAITYLHTDHLGTPRVGSNSSGASVWDWTSDAFGNGAPTGTATVNLRFAGQYWDDETDLHYNWNRYYDPETGRYISSDPIGLAGGLNTYGYVGANPVMYTDPEGLYFDEKLAEEIAIKVGQAVGTGVGVGTKVVTGAAGVVLGVCLPTNPTCATHPEVFGDLECGTGDDDNDCPKRVQKVNDALYKVKKRFSEQLANKKKMYEKRFETKDWDNHTESLKQAQSNLRRAIKSAKFKDCKYPAEADIWVDKVVPEKPTGY